MSRFCYLAIIVLSCGVPAVADGLTQTVALTGKQASGFPSGANFGQFDLAVLNSSGDVAFHGILQGSGIQPQGVWTFHNGALSRVAGTGDSAPGTGSGITFDGFTAPVIDDAGHVAFSASMKGSGVTSNDTGLWSDIPGALTLIGRAGDHLPGIESAAPLRYFRRPVISPDGQLAMKSFHSANPENDEALWSYKNGQLELVAREGTASPVSGATYGTLADPYSDSYGNIGFGASLTTSVFDLQGGLWVRQANGTLRQVWISYSQAPDLPSGIKTTGGISDFNTNGSVAYRGLLKWTEYSATSDEAIFSDRNGQMSLVVREGTQAPGTAAGVVFNTFFMPPVMNDSGKIVFYSFLTGPGINPNNSHGIWSVDGSNSPQLIARTGSAVPGLAGYTFSSLGEPILNNAGQIAFASLLNGPGVSNIGALWAQNGPGVLTLIAKTGQLLDVDDGPGVDLRTIRELKLTLGVNGDDGKPIRFNDRGQLVFWADFTDNSSGIFVSNVVAVPEPNSIAIALWGIAISTSVIRRRKSFPGDSRAELGD